MSIFGNKMPVFHKIIQEIIHQEIQPIITIEIQPIIIKKIQPVIFTENQQDIEEEIQKLYESKIKYVANTSNSDKTNYQIKDFNEKVQNKSDIHQNICEQKPKCKEAQKSDIDQGTKVPIPMEKSELETMNLGGYNI